MTTTNGVRLKRLNADIPESLHHAFKMACLTRRENMTEVLANFITAYVKQVNHKT